MRPKLILLALCLCALGVMLPFLKRAKLLGQNGPALVGMPELGVTLTGTAEHPEVVDNSGRGILGYVILSVDAKGHRSLMPTLKTDDLRWALVRPTPAPRSGPMPTPPRVSSDKDSADDGPPVQAILDAVIFDNGQFAGPDSGQYFEILSGQVDGERTLGQAVSGKKVSWDELEVLAPRRLPDSNAEAFALLEALAPPGRPSAEDFPLRAPARRAAEMMLAGELLSIRAKYGEAAALAMADWTAKLPVLWKAK